MDSTPSRIPPRVSFASPIEWTNCRIESRADETVRDPVEALSLAKSLVQRSANVPKYLESLAAAQYANGRAKAAAQTARRAIAIAKQKGYDPLVALIGAQLAVYEQAARSKSE